MSTFLSTPSPAFASLSIFLSASIWGLYWVPLRYLEGQGVEGGWAVAMLNLPAGLIMLLVLLWQWQRCRGQLVKALIIGILTGLGIALYTSGIIYSSVVRATLLFYMTPVWATLIGIYWLGEKASWQRWVAIAVGLLGLLLLVSGGGSMPLNIGDFYALLSGVVWAFGAAMIMRYDDLPLPGMTMFQFFFAATGAVLLGYISGVEGVPAAAAMREALPLSTLVSVLMILPTVLIIFWAQKFLFPGRAGLLMMSEVLMAVVSASIFLPEEHMSLIEWMGAVLIITACLIEVFAVSEEGKA